LTGAFESTALADSHDVVHDAEVNGAGANSGVGNDPIHDAEVGQSTHGGASDGRKPSPSASSGNSDAIHDAETGGGSKSSSTSDDPVEHHYAIEGNPLGIFIGRYSAQFEWLPISHHAFLINPHFDYASISVNGESVGHVVGAGAELGYRFYTSRYNLAGFYVGPSLLAGTYSSGGGTGDSVSFQSLGFAVDIGGQAVIGPGVVIGGGFGLQYTTTTKDFGSTDGLNLAAEILVGGGWRPRFLLSVGYAF
jgi:hypothetical protein